MNYDNEVLICHGDDIVLSNGAYSGVNKPFKTLEAIGKISDSVYRQKLSLYGCDLDIYVFKTRSNMEHAYAQCTDHCFSDAYKCILSTLSVQYL